MIPNPRYCDSKEALSMYRFVGNLIGISLRTKHLLPFEFCPQIWKTIVDDIVTEEDIGRVIGKGGKTANAIRTLVQASSSLHDQKYVKINFDKF